MKLLLLSSVRRLWRNSRRYLAFLLTLLLSVFMISFLISFTQEVLVFLQENIAYRALPFGSFLSAVAASMSVTVCFLVLAAILTIAVHSGIHREEDRAVFAMLTSIGATAGQKNLLRFFEAALYLAPIMLGALAGRIASRGCAVHLFAVLAGGEVASDANILADVGFVIVVAACGMLLVCGARFFPSFSRKRSVNYAMRRIDRRVIGEKHSFRKSGTFRSMTVLGQLAMKNADFYKSFYRGTTTLFAVSALYPALGVLFFLSIMNVQIVLDSNPYDGADTAASVLSAVDGMMLFFLAGFGLLSLFGAVQACHMLRVHKLEQREKFRIYRTAGMTESELATLLRREYGMLAWRSLLAILVLLMVTAAVFRVLTG